MEILLYYILPNIALFGGIYLLTKGIESSSWYVIINYERLVDKLTKQ
jgi:hypothetical protein